MNANRYRVVMTFEAADDGEAAAIAASPERLPRYATIRLENLGRRQTVRLAVILGLTIAFWVGLATIFVRVWRMVP